MQELVTELRKHVPFKDSTAPGDLVLIAAENPRMLVYARVEGIELDKSRKDSWWHITMHLLTVPPQLIVWTLREAQFTGREIFSMGGDERFMQAVRLEAPLAGAAEGDVAPGPSEKITPFRRVK